MFKKLKKLQQNKKGFTLIEILVVIGLIAILAAVVLIAINPARQFALGRNSQRTSNVNAILNTIGQNLVDNKGTFTCAADLRPCIVSTYISEIPVDPNVSGATNTCVDTSPGNCNSGTYDTMYTVMQDATTKRVTVCAPGGAESAIAGSTAICITR